VIYVHRFGGKRYTWAPSRSTPSAPDPVAELSDIINLLRKRGARTIVDFGAGRGRNASKLVRQFTKVYLVEVDGNLSHLRKLARQHRWHRCRIISWDDFERRRVLADAALLCCVLHTIPSKRLREEVLKRNLRNLANDGILVIVSPKGDSKYRGDYLRGLPVLEKGIARLHEADPTFSYYRNYAKGELEELLLKMGLQVVDEVPSRGRHVMLAERLNGEPNRARGRVLAI
jgi:SAM-dependent methyltransferase